MLWQHVPYSLRYSNSCLHGFIPMNVLCWNTSLLLDLTFSYWMVHRSRCAGAGWSGLLGVRSWFATAAVLLMAARPSIGTSTEPQRLRVDRLFLTKGSVDAADSLSCAYQSRRSPAVCESLPPSWHDHSRRDPCDVTHAGCWGEGRVHCASVPGMKIDEHTNKSWYVFLWVQVEWKKKTSIVLPVLLF